MTKFGKLTTFGIIIAVLVVTGFSIWFFNTTKKITTYEECTKAGWLVRNKMHYDGFNLFPTKYECVLWGGKKFEKYEKKQEIQKEKELKIQEVVDMIPSNTISGSETQEWKRYTSGKLGISFKYPPNYIIVKVKESGTPTIGASDYLQVLKDTPYNRQYAKTIDPDFDYIIPEDQKNVDIEPGQGISFFRSIKGDFTQDVVEWYRENKSGKNADSNVYASANFIGMNSVVYRAEGLFTFDGVMFEKEGYLYQFSVQYYNSPESPKNDFYKIISTVEFQ